MLKLRNLIALLLPLSLIACASNGSRAEKAEVYAPDNPDTMTSAVTADGRPGWMPPPLFKMEPGSRVGIMSAVGNQISSLNDESETLRPGFDLPNYTASALRKNLFANTPYGAVLIPPSARLMANKATWQKSWNEKTKSFGDNWQKEFDAVIKQNGLAMLVIISEPEVSKGSLRNSKIQGSGYSSRGGVGKGRTAVYSTMHFFQIKGVPGKLLTPVRPENDPLYLDIPNFPKEIPSPFPRPMQEAIERELRRLIDQKIAAFVTMMK